MFELGREYRVFVGREGFGNREGVLVDVDGPVFTLNVDGVHTIFHLASVAFVERVDAQAENARSAARTEAWSKAIG